MDDQPKVELKVIFWDFDGVLLNSNQIRDYGFEQVLQDYPDAEVAQLLAYHRANGGLSRYVKFRYFFEVIRGESVTETDIADWADKFSVIMRRLLQDPGLLIGETLDFVKEHHELMPMYIVSGSDQRELRFLCESMQISSYFRRIHGSPIPKKEWVGTILAEEGHDPSECLLIGDAINDFLAAEANGLHFMAYNNPDIADKTTLTIDLKSSLRYS